MQQVVDKGLDESSCFFADEDGKLVEHGHMFEGLRLTESGNFTTAGSHYFPFDLTRRKVSDERVCMYIRYLHVYIGTTVSHRHRGNHTANITPVALMPAVFHPD